MRTGLTEGQIKLDRGLLTRFEEGLNTIRPELSTIPAQVLGYGEVSCIFAIDQMPGLAFKRMPLFKDTATACQYEENYFKYCNYLEQAGLSLPPSATAVIEIPGRPVALYIAQQLLAKEHFCNAMLKKLERPLAKKLVQKVANSLCKVWEFNALNTPALELGVDGQLSNWAFSGGDIDSEPLFLDTSTPLFRINRVETMNPELLLQAVPFFLRPPVRFFFLDEVMTRYYDPRRVFVDIAANLQKEKLPFLLDAALEVLNGRLPLSRPVTLKEVSAYYRSDKLIWRSFLALRKMERFLTARLKGGHYPFILPGKIDR
ncbi:MAG: DUF6206 family protein [Desulfatibacillaceae bacterium]|nr:DUF6206 family protein [Desulfatibacillaceae bacterium]